VTLERQFTPSEVRPQASRYDDGPRTGGCCRRTGGGRDCLASRSRTPVNLTGAVSRRLREYPRGRPANDERDRHAVRHSRGQEVGLTIALDSPKLGGYAGMFDHMPKRPLSAREGTGRCAKHFAEWSSQPCPQLARNRAKEPTGATGVEQRSR